MKRPGDEGPKRALNKMAQYIRGLGLDKLVVTYDFVENRPLRVRNTSPGHFYTYFDLTYDEMELVKQVCREAVQPSVPSCGFPNTGWFHFNLRDNVGWIDFNGRALPPFVLETKF